MSEAREIENPLGRPAAKAFHAIQGRFRSWRSHRDGAVRISRTSLRSEEAEVRASPNTISSFANSVVRIASIDLDYDPWWLYFRRRR